MRIDRLRIENFKCFDEREFSFHPQFTLIAGVNGTGKTSLLDALAVALGSWFLGISGSDSRSIRATELRLQPITSGMGEDALTHWESQSPCRIYADGEVVGEPCSWSRALNSEQGRTTYADAYELKQLAVQSVAVIKSEQEGGRLILPLVSYYGTGRLWNAPREQAEIKDLADLGELKFSRLDGYQNSIDPRLSVTRTTRWIARQTWIAFQKKGHTPAIFNSVRDAIISCVEGACDLYFDADYGEVIIEFDGQGRQPFNNLSDGQRCMLAMVGDIAIKAATLNPQLGEHVLAETPGVVLIDELDLHLHPQWQRHIIEDLRTTFPKIQFIATSHSPFLIQSLRSGEELLLLDGQPTAELANLPIGEITQGIMGVPNAEVSLRYGEMKGAAKHYLELLEEAALAPEEKLAQFRERLADTIAPYADNPAYQALLEMKRAAKLGE
jgi:predicted ATP-binding protein involved in virulence